MTSQSESIPPVFTDDTTFAIPLRSAPEQIANSDELKTTPLFTALPAVPFEPRGVPFSPLHD